MFLHLLFSVFVMLAFVPIYDSIYLTYIFCLYSAKVILKVILTITDWASLGKMVAQCTRIAYVVWRGLRLLRTWRKSFVSYASARVSMSKNGNRYLAKIDIWHNSNLWSEVGAAQ